MTYKRALAQWEVVRHYSVLLKKEDIFMSTALAFDTLQYAKRLKQVGFTEEQAEVQAEALSELIDDRLATKRDIKELEKEIKNIEERLVNKINDMGYKITIKLGGMMITGVVTLGAFLALIKFLA